MNVFLDTSAAIKLYHKEVGSDELLAFCGRNDRKIQSLQKGLGAEIRARGNEIAVSGDHSSVERATRVIEDLLRVQRESGRPISTMAVSLGFPTRPSGRSAVA